MNALLGEIEDWQVIPCMLIKDMSIMKDLSKYLTKLLLCWLYEPFLFLILFYYRQYVYWFILMILHVLPEIEELITLDSFV